MFRGIVTSTTIRSYESVNNSSREINQVLRAVKTLPYFIEIREGEINKVYDNEKDKGVFLGKQNKGEILN